MTADLFGQRITLCLSLWQPWASLMALGFKRHETRHWWTAVRGQVATHAAKHIETDIEPELEELCRFAFGDDWRVTLPRGAVVSVGQQTGCYPTGELLKGGLDACDALSGNFMPGRFALRHEHERPLLQPIPLTGRQGFFRWSPPEDLEERLGPEIDHDAKAVEWLERPREAA